MGPTGVRRRLLWMVPAALVAGVLVGTAVDRADPSRYDNSAVSRPAVRAGSLPVGQARYPVPDDALFVAPSGDDAADGTRDRPWRTVGHAVETAPTERTVVLRGGEYHETVLVPAGRRLVVQAYPGEAVWFDGSRPVEGWVAEGGRWHVDGWTVDLDDSPTYTSGAPDGTDDGTTFVNPAHPLAAHPDMVFVDGAGQREVGGIDEVTAGTFFVDKAAQRLYLGSDPAGHAVRASDLTLALTVRGEGSVLRGFGVRRYATPVPGLGAVRALADRVRLTDLVVSDNATRGVFAGGDVGTAIALERLTVERNGLMGLAANTADGLTVTDVRVVGNNTEKFNPSPSAGGFKVTHSRRVSVRDSTFAGNTGTGLWFDESVDDAVVTGVDATDNTVHGLSFEISARGVFADNRLLRNGGTGVKVNDSTDVQLWNNTVAGNGDRPVWLVQDRRQAADLSVPGHDPRRPVNDPTMTWLLGTITVRDNLLSSRKSLCLLCLEDVLARPFASLGVTADGDVYDVPPGGLAASWSGAGGFRSVADLRAGTGQELRGRALRAAVDNQGRPAATLARRSGDAVPLDPRVAALVGRPAGSRHLGAWLR
jgi:trimeric autotransporter adhesin